MEARDLGDTITLYLPQASKEAEPYAVLQGYERVGSFATRDESVRFALALAETLHAGRKVPVRMRIEDDAGHWETKDAVSLTAPHP